MRSPLNGSPAITCDAPCHGYGATDWGVGEGTPVYAMFAGTINTFWLNGGGNTLDLHGQGLQAHYAHLHSYAVLDGATVSEGQLIAYSGNTGSLTTGPHLHVGLLDSAGNAITVNGQIAGPFEYLNSIGYNWSGEEPQPIPLTIPPEGIKNMAEPIYARGDQANVVYALYLNAEVAGDRNKDASGAIYSGRRGPVSAGELAIVTKLGFPHPKQTELIVIPQAQFDAINKLAFSG